MSGSDGVLGRWARRKAEARQQSAAADDREEQIDGIRRKGSTNQETAPAPLSAEQDGATAEPRLPDIETLDQDSDFSLFMQRGVPDALRKQALRKLWRLDPAFSKLDGLVEYGEDYNAASRRPKVVRTAWRIGRGIAGPEADGTGEGALPEETRPAAGTNDEGAVGAGSAGSEMRPESPASEDGSGGGSSRS